MILNTSVESTFEDLVSLVRACQKQNVKGKSGTWADFVKVQKQGGQTDPKRHPKEVLEAFVADLLADDQPSANGAQAVGAADGTITTAAAAAATGRAASSATSRDFVQRYLKWLEKERKDAAKGRGALPPLEPVEPAPGGSRTPHQQQQQQQQVSVWSLVRRTRAHTKYNTFYGNLPSYVAGWTRVKRPLLSAAVRPRLLALDCEMCATDGDSSALLGVCVVDEFGEVIYRQLVRPAGRITDLRTALTGVTEADLEGVTLTAKDAQRAVRKLLEGEATAQGGSASGGAAGGGRPVILVGHSLHHDLAALRLDHQPVIDTSLIFSLKGLPSCIPGLKDLAKGLLGMDMRRAGGGVHDSREDAAVAMRLVMRELQMAAPTAPLEPPNLRVSSEDLAKLLAHSLPSGVGEEALRAAFAAAGAPAFERTEPNPGDPKQLLLVFRNPAVANEAFKKLPGHQHKDSVGRFYKSVPLGSETGRSCKIRKMACHNGMAFGTVIGGADGGGAAAAAKPGPKRGAKRSRSSERSGGGAGGAGATQQGGEDVPAAAATPTANGSERKAKRRKRGDGGTGGAGGGDPVREAGKRPREGADARAAPAPALAPAAGPAAGGVAGVPGAAHTGGGPAEAAAAAAPTGPAGGAQPGPQPQPKRRKRRTVERAEGQPGAAAAAVGGEAGAVAAGAGTQKREGDLAEKKKRKRSREAETGKGAAPGGPGVGTAGEGGVSPTGEKARKKARKRAE